MLLLSGEIGESDLRIFPPAKDDLYRRYAVNSFVMSTPSPLGHINNIRLMHDNSGKHPYDTWQVQNVIVRDLQTREKYFFDTNKWLAFNRDDGKIDRIFQVSEGKGKSTFTQEMYAKSNQSANQDHIWLSIFMRPPESRFDRKERISVCASFLYLCMVVSAMWYDTDAENPHTTTIQFFSFVLSAEQTIIGVIVICIVYPFSLMLISIFKRARPRNLKKCRAIESIKKQKEGQRKENDDFDDLKKIDVGDIEIINENAKAKAKPKDRSPVRCFPWWTRIIAWILVLISIGASTFFVWSYGVMWGEIKTQKWFSSFITGFFVSLIVTQWLKVLCYALVSAAICKTDRSTDDVDCDEELPNLKQDEEWRHLQPLDPSDKRKLEEIEGVDADDPDIERLRVNLTKEREMGFVMRGIFGYCLFLVILLVIVSGKTDYNAYLLQTHMKNAFIKPGHRILDFNRVSLSKCKFVLYFNLNNITLLKARYIYCVYIYLVKSEINIHIIFLL